MEELNIITVQLSNGESHTFHTPEFILFTDKGDRVNVLANCSIAFYREAHGAIRTAVNSHLEKVNAKLFGPSESPVLH